MKRGMRRREFVTLLGGAAAAWPVGARAQQDDMRRALQLRILRLHVEAAADKIVGFIANIEGQVGWTTQLPWSAGNLDRRRIDGLRLLRQVPAIATLSQLDSAGLKQLVVSRKTMDVAASKTDYSEDPKFTEAMAKKVYYGSVYFPGPQRCDVDRGDVLEVDAISGVGIGVTFADGQVKVVYPMENMPAAKAGIVAGDIIVALDDRPLAGIALDQVVEKLRGPANTQIKLTITRGGRDRPIEFVITRDVIRENSRVSRCPAVPQTEPFRATPYMTLAVAGTRRDAGVSVAEVNLALVQDLVAKMDIGDNGIAYIVDAQDRVIAHRNRDLVNADLSSNTQVRAARAGSAVASAGLVQSIDGRAALTAYVTIAKLGWLVFAAVALEETDVLAR